MNPITIPIAMTTMGLGLLAFVAYRLGFPQRYIDYWSKASVATTPGVEGVSAKRAVFIHVAAVAGLVLMKVVESAGWTFNKESLEAFNTFCYTFAGAYALGKGLEYAGSKIATKSPTEGA